MITHKGFQIVAANPTGGKAGKGLQLVSAHGINPPHFMRKLRLALAKWLWPKDVRQGELFTIVRHMREGKPTGDGSWVGQTLRADKVEGDRIQFSVQAAYANPTRFDKIETFWAIPGQNCIVKPVAMPLTKAEQRRLYDDAKVGSNIVSFGGMV